MSIIKTLEMLGQDPSQSVLDLSEKQRQEIQRLKEKAEFLNANMIIHEPDEPDDSPDPDRDPDT